MLKKPGSKAPLEISPRNVALTGFMAVGKSAVGRRLAQKLKRPFVDLDRAIEAEEGMKVSEIFSRRGEPYFRRVEKNVLQQVLSRDGQVIASSGGAVLDEENLKLFKRRSTLICLTAAPEVLLKRLRRNSNRPLLQGKDRAKAIAELLAQREGSYAQADVHIDTSALSTDQVVETIMRKLPAAGRKASGPAGKLKADR